MEIFLMLLVGFVVYLAMLYAFRWIGDNVSYEQVVAFMDKARAYRDAGTERYKERQGEESAGATMRFVGVAVGMQMLLVLITPIPLDSANLWYWLALALTVATAPFVMKVYYGWKISRTNQKTSDE